MGLHSTREPPHVEFQPCPFSFFSILAELRQLIKSAENAENLSVASHSASCFIFFASQSHFHFYLGIHDLSVPMTPHQALCSLMSCTHFFLTVETGSSTSSGPSQAAAAAGGVEVHSYDAPMRQSCCSLESLFADMIVISQCL